MIAKGSMIKIASFSGGKDSTAMVLKLIEEHWQLDEVVFFDTQLEFKSVYRNVEKMRLICEEKGIKFTTLRNDNSVWFDMLIRPVNTRSGKDKFGYSWCGGNCRWGTTFKTQSINNYLKGRDVMQYIGIALDEPARIKQESNKEYPLVAFGMTEKDCLRYCYSKGFDWLEDGVDLYSVMDRVSCWCCRNKNLKELRALYKHFPYYWRCLKGIQSRIDEPFKEKASIFSLEERFKSECQLELDL